MNAQLKALLLALLCATALVVVHAADPAGEEDLDAGAAEGGENEGEDGEFDDAEGEEGEDDGEEGDDEGEEFDDDVEDEGEDDEVDLEHEKEFFKQSDANSDGALDFDEFKALLKEEGEPELSEAEAMEAFKEHDTDNDGKITLDEWQKFFFHDDPQDAEFVDGVDQSAISALEEKDFNELDTNKDGNITHDELLAHLEAAKEAGAKVDDETKKALEELVRNIDSDQNGSINEEEWKSIH